VRQPLAWHHHRRADRDPGEKTVDSVVQGSRVRPH
jgi:hypothetical protein